jgi:hypothetical protein
VTPGTATIGLARHPDQAEQRTITEETTMRHALVPVHLIHSARTAAASARHDAEPDPAELEIRPTRRARRARRSRRSRRSAPLLRRARA